MYNIIEEALASNKTKEILYAHFKEKFYENAGNAAICCFSKNPLNLLLWAHYSDCHKGICLGFDSEILCESFGVLYDVSYSKKLPDINIFGDVNQAVTEFFRTKSTHWNYEKESRLIKKGAGSFGFPKEALKQVIFGVKSTAQDQLKILSKMGDNNYDHVQFYQTAIDRDFYKLSIKEINLIKNAWM